MNRSFLIKLKARTPEGLESPADLDHPLSDLLLQQFQALYGKRYLSVCGQAVPVWIEGVTVQSFAPEEN